VFFTPDISLYYTSFGFFSQDIKGLFPNKKRTPPARALFYKLQIPMKEKLFSCMKGISNLIYI